MKLRNKRTGEIMQLSVKCENGGELKTFDSNTNTDRPITLAELNEEWEDAPEEPKDFWYIGDLMIICGTEGEFTTPDLASFTKKDIEKLKAIGNYFESKEEAEKAVEKLKAFKRLNNCGLKFIDWWLSKDNHIIIGTNRQIFDIDEQGLREDLDICFGGEE